MALIDVHQHVIPDVYKKHSRVSACWAAGKTRGRPGV